MQSPWKVVTYILFIDGFQNEDFMIMKDDNSNLSSTQKLSPILLKNPFARFLKIQRWRETKFKDSEIQNSVFKTEAKMSLHIRRILGSVQIPLNMPLSTQRYQFFGQITAEHTKRLVEGDLHILTRVLLTSYRQSS